MRDKRKNRLGRFFTEAGLILVASAVLLLMYKPVGQPPCRGEAGGDPGRISVGKQKSFRGSVGS